MGNGGPSPAVHDLLRLHPSSAEESGDESGDAWLPPSVPAWARERIRDVPWVVVRRAAAPRAHPDEPVLAVGVRGVARHERWAMEVPADHAVAFLRPEDLVHRLEHLPPARVRAVPALTALVAARSILTDAGVVWGPGGSVGFELATGTATAGEHSDLDLIVRAPMPLSRARATELHSALSALPGRIDTLVEAPPGAVALDELAHGSLKLLLRTPTGPRLTSDPWTEQEPTR